MTDAVTLTLTPAEHAHILLRLGRGTGSTIRPGESLSAQQELELVEKVATAKRDAALSELAQLDAPYL